MSIYERLMALGLELPPFNPPAANYVPVVCCGNMAYTAGQTPKLAGVLQYKGKVVSVEEGYQAARLCALNCLGQLDKMDGGLDNIARIVKVVGFVNSVPDFTAQSGVLDGASDLLGGLFGEAGRHARSAVGVAALPGDAMCEVEMVVELKQPV